MDIIKAFQNNDIFVNIMIKGTPENPLFRASDIGKVLDIANIRQNISDFDENEKTSLIINTKGGDQVVNFLTTNGLKKIICKSRKPKAIAMGKLIGIEIKDTYHVPFETSFVKLIKEIYKNENIIHQFKVDKYIIDIYFPEYKLIIECDEYFHEFQKDEDYKRETYLKNILNCKILRYKQTKKNDNLGKILFDINDILINQKLNGYKLSKSILLTN